MIRAYREMPKQRPDNFRWNPASPYAKGCKFALLGNAVGGGKAYDSSPGRNTGTLTNMDPSTDWVFDAELDRWRVDVSASSLVVPGLVGPWSALTLCFWLNSEAFRYDYIWRIDDTDYLYFYDGNNASEPHFYLRDTLPYSSVSVRADSAINDDQWYHVVCRWDGSSMDMWIDGIQQTDVAAYSGGPLSFSEGLVQYTGNNKLSDVLFYNRGISSSEIQQLADPSNVMLSGLILPPRRTWWPVATASTPTTLDPHAVATGWSLGMA